MHKLCAAKVDERFYGSSLRCHGPSLAETKAHRQSFLDSVEDKDFETFSSSRIRLGTWGNLCYPKPQRLHEFQAVLLSKLTSLGVEPRNVLILRSGNIELVPSLYDFYWL